MCVCVGLWEGLSVWRRDVLRGEFVDPQPAYVHAHGTGRRRLSPHEPPGETSARPRTVTRHWFVSTERGNTAAMTLEVWLMSLSVTPYENEISHRRRLSHLIPLCSQVPFFGKRLHHTCPCLPNLSCVTIEEGRSKCLSTYKYPDYYLWGPTLRVTLFATCTVTKPVSTLVF